jgi:RNA polymerase sigma-70 factor (ECF subfamily)
MKYCGRITIKELGDIFELGESAMKMKLKRVKEKLIANYRASDLENLKLV